MWFSVNRLSLNFGKTNYMLFRSRPPDNELALEINNVIPNTSHFILYHVTKKQLEISHELSTVTTSPIHGASCYSMRGRLLQRDLLPLFVLRTYMSNFNST